MKIYLVWGSTGEYSDRTDWTVCAYRSKAKAEDHASKAMRRGKEIQKSEEWQEHRRDPDKCPKNEFDPQFQMDYTGTEYGTAECELRG